MILTVCCGIGKKVGESEICKMAQRTAPTIQDLQPDVFDNLVEFINTGHCEVGKLIDELFITVKKHKIEVLKGIFIETLQNKLTVNNTV
jgi:hypothetical protein